MTEHTLYRSAGYLITAFSLLILTACSTTSITPAAKTASPSQPRSAAEWMALADGAAPADRARYQLEAARLYYEAGDLANTRRIVSNTDPQSLQGAAISNWLVLSARVIAAEEGPETAVAWLRAPPQRALLDQTSSADQVPVYLQLAELQNDAGRRLDSINIRIHIASHLPDETARRSNQQAIWQTLMTLPASQINAQLQRLPANQETMRGWLELALIALDNQGYIDEQQQQLAQWERNWPNHPGARPLPDDLALLKKLALDSGAHIAVLLPGSGSLKQVGSAVRDGIMAAYFDARARSAAVPPLVFYDTAAGANIRELYRKAVVEGADLVIGPLSKDRVTTLSTLAELSIPVLALNYADQDAPTNDNFYQFGISTSDDARAAAERALEKRYQRAMIILDSDKAAERTAEAFQEAWEAQGGEVGAVIELDSASTASNDIRDGLHIQRSQQRAQIVESVIGERVEFTPRRRHDLDFVYLPVSYQQARSIKPLLAFHYAQDLPTYASSRVYRGQSDPRADADLNGIVFTDTPWILGAAPLQYQRIANYVEQGATPSKNLYALGIDAFNIVPRVPLMANSPSARFSGLTGTLMVSTRGHIIRQPAWAVFRNGKADLLEDGYHDIQALSEAE